jgi:glycosyltransferase involved in cell wall biosynthesis
MEKKPISVIISAFDARDYIIDCLDSIERQTYFEGNDNYEILVGIDGCWDTADMLMDVKFDYRNINTYIMDVQESRYLVLNTLMEVVKNDIVFVFEANDIMCDDMIERCMEFSDYGIVRVGNYNFENKKEKPITINSYPDDEAIMLHKSIMDIVGGYWPRRIHGGRDLIKRLEGRVNIKDIEEPLFHRRIHKKNLFYDNHYGFYSLHAINGRRAINKWHGDDVKIIPEVNEFTINCESRLMTEIVPVSIVIAAYKAQGFIEECLDSIEGQSYFKDNDEYEVLIGVDGCEETLNRIKEISHKYRNIRVFMNKENVGAYRTVNTLMGKANNDIILRFDADDVMKPTMLRRGMFYAVNNDVVQFGYDSFVNDINKAQAQKFRCADGCVFIKKEFFKKTGGFRAWECAADSEFLFRVRNHAKIHKVRSRVFYRRVHGENLTRRADTAIGSPKRLAYRSQVRVYGVDEDIKIETITVEQDEISLS